MRLQLGIRVALLASSLAGTATLAACTTTGVPASSHHIVSTTTLPPGALPPGPGAAPATASDPIDTAAATQSYDQIQSDLSSVDSNLSQVSSDLSTPGGDS